MDETKKDVNNPAGAESVLNAGLEHIDASMVKRLATQTSLDLWPGWVNNGRGLTNLIAFAKAVAAFEREQCAKICDELRGSKTLNGARLSPDGSACAKAIRMRSNV